MQPVQLAPIPARQLRRSAHLALSSTTLPRTAARLCGSRSGSPSLLLLLLSAASPAAAAAAAAPPSAAAAGAGCSLAGGSAAECR